MLNPTLALTCAYNKELPWVFLHEIEGYLSISKLQMGGRIYCSHKDAIDDFILLSNIIDFKGVLVIVVLKFKNSVLY